MSEQRDSEEAEYTRLEGLYRKASDLVLRTHSLKAWRMSPGGSIREASGTVDYSEKRTMEIARHYESEGARDPATAGAMERRCRTRWGKRSCVKPWGCLPAKGWIE